MADDKDTSQEDVAGHTHAKTPDEGKEAPGVRLDHPEDDDTEGHVRYQRPDEEGKPEAPATRI